MSPDAPPLPAIVPSLYAADHAALADAVSACRALGLRTFHVDVMDGRLVPALGLSFGAVASLAARFGDCAFDLHLMVEDAERHLDAALDCGARRVTVQVDGARFVQAALDRIRAGGARPGVALGPAADPRLGEVLAGDAEHLLVMLVNPGRRGEAVRPSALRLLRTLRRALPGHPLIADGSVDAPVLAEIVPLIHEAVCGTALFRDGPAAGLARLGGCRGDAPAVAPWR